MPPRRRSIALAFTLALGACAATTERVAVVYHDAGRSIATTVDSPLARYAVERTRAASTPVARDATHDARHDGPRAASGASPRQPLPVDPHWEAYIDGLVADTTLAADPVRLRRLAELVSVDFATAVFREQVNARPANRAFRERVARLQARIEADDQALGDAMPRRVRTAYGARPESLEPLPRVRLVLVPGWRYRSSPANGADLERAAALARKLDLPWSRIETPEDGTVEENAARIAAWIGSYDGSEPLVVVSASKGGPEVALALDRLQDSPATERVLAWINISGLVGGSPLADRSMSWPARMVVGALLKLTGGSLRPVPSMTVERSRERLASIRLPDHLLVLNYFAAPLSGEVSSTGAITYSMLRAFGPNDGLGLLSDSRMPGVSLIEPGVDHFLADEALAPRLEAVLRATVALAEERLAERGAPPLARAVRGTMRIANHR